MTFECHGKLTKRLVAEEAMFFITSNVIPAARVIRVIHHDSTQILTLQRILVTVSCNIIQINVARSFNLIFIKNKETIMGIKNKEEELP